MARGLDGTHLLAGGGLTMLAYHRLVVDLIGLIRVLTLKVAVDADPVQLTPHQHLVFADDRDVVLGVTRDNTVVAAGALVEVYRHSPLVTVVADSIVPEGQQWRMVNSALDSLGVLLESLERVLTHDLR